MENQQKTPMSAKQILDNIINTSFLEDRSVMIWTEDCIKAMRKFAAQKTGVLQRKLADKQAEIEKLKSNNEDLESLKILHEAALSKYKNALGQDKYQELKAAADKMYENARLYITGRISTSAPLVAAVVKYESLTKESK